MTYYNEFTRSNIAFKKNQPDLYLYCKNWITIKYEDWTILMEK